MDVNSRVGNTQYFQEQGSKLVSFANRHNLPMGIALVGVDNLKGMVEQYGFDAEEQEELINMVGSTIATLTRKEDSIARLGKGIFGVLLPSTDIKLAYKFSEKVQATLKKSKFTLSNQAIKVTVSIGIEASEPERKRKLQGLIKVSQERLVKATKMGNEIRPALRKKEDTTQIKLDSLDKALVHFDKKHGTQIAKNVLPIIKGK